MAQVTWQPNLTFGAGYDTVRGEARQRGAVGTIAVQPNAAGQSGDSAFIQIRSTEDFDQALGIDAEISGGFGLFGASAKFEYKKRCKVSSQATFCVIRVFATNAYEQLQDPKLHDEAWTLLENGNTKRFRQRFGDAFVSGQVAGIEFYGTVRIEAEQVEKQEEIAAKIQASYGPMLSGSASTNFSESMNSSSHRIEVFAYQKGGSVNFAGDVNDLLRFAKQTLDEGRAGRAYPFGVELDAYEELKLPNDDASFIDAESARRNVQKLAGHMDALERISNDITFVLRNQQWFESPDIVALNNANDVIEAEMNTIKDKAEVCSKDFDQCQAYEPDYPVIQLPPRKAGAAAAMPTETPTPQDEFRGRPVEIAVGRIPGIRNP